MSDLTLTAEQILSELGIKQLPQRKREVGAIPASRVIFKKDMQKKRGLEIREQVVKEIMDNRGISREDALRVMNNPFR